MCLIDGRLFGKYPDFHTFFVEIQSRFQYGSEDPLAAHFLLGAPSSIELITMDVMNDEMTWVETGALVLVAIGALNWGLIGFGGLIDVYGNVVNLFFGVVGLLGLPVELLESLFYLLIGLSGIYLIYASLWR